MKQDVARALLELSLAAQEARGAFRFPQSLPVFAGHFPGAPIVPGVYLIEAARLLAERLCGGSLILSSVEQAKFTSALMPDDRVEATVKLDLQGARILCAARFQGPRGEAARLRLSLVRQD